MGERCAWPGAPGISGVRKGVAPVEGELGNARVRPKRDDLLNFSKLLIPPKDRKTGDVCDIVKVVLLASAIGVLLLTGCVQQHVDESLSEAAVVEGRRYAEEVEAQSPFETVEIQWSAAEDLMEQRNPAFVAARRSYAEAVEEKPLVGELASEVKSAMGDSLGDVFDTDLLLKSLKSPATQLPRQLASLGKLKDLTHQMEQSAWDDAAASVDAEMTMRKEKVRLHRLLRMGELIDAELERVESAKPEAASDPAVVKAVHVWRASLEDEREKWLTEVRDVFDAEYHDVRFIRDGSGLPTYRSLKHPDLGEWERWCRLRRSKEVVTLLGEQHGKDKPSIPGADLVTDKFADLMNPDDGPEHVRDTDSVRREVRSLIQNWREMKDAQEQAKRLERANDKVGLDSVARVGARQKIFKFRSDEIQHASVVWMLDEDCWH